MILEVRLAIADYANNSIVRRSLENRWRIGLEMNAHKSVLKSSNTAGILVVTITEPHIRTPETSHAVSDALIETVTSEKAEKVVLDLCHVTFIGSVGLLGFLALRKTEGVNEIVVCNLSSTIKSMFIACRLISEKEGREPAPFGYAESVAEAMTQISGVVE